MFSDIVGYTLLMGANEDEAFRVLRINRKIHKMLLGKYDGTFIKEMGDGILASFSSVSHAIQCALEIQEKAKVENIKLRIGIHQGEMVFEGGDVLGDGVNVASRLEELAQEGSIYISGTVQKEIRNKAGIQYEFIEETSLKNVEEPVKVYKVTSEGQYNFDQIPGKAEAAKKRGNAKKIFLIAGPVMTAILIAVGWMFLKPVTPSAEPGGKVSIAVLPFRNESEEKGTEYFANGVMEAILSDLSKISELRVPGRTSVEQFRDRTTPIQQIAKKLGVTFILEGSVQKYENTVRVSLQLIDARNDRHLWSMQTDKEYKNILKVESDLAQEVARELRVRITPEERKKIEKISTANLTAYDMFLRARENHWTYWLDKKNKASLENAILLYRRTLQYDSTFAQAYTGLAIAFFDLNYLKIYFNDALMDSSLALANKGLRFNIELEEAYYVRGMYYYEKGDYQQSGAEFNQSLIINPNYSWGYWQRGNLNALGLNDFVNGMKDLLMATRLDRGPSLPLMLWDIGDILGYIGFTDKAKYYYQEAFNLDNDTLKYLGYQSRLELMKGNFEKAIALAGEALKMDSMNYNAADVRLIGSMFSGAEKEFYQSAVKCLRMDQEPGSFIINRMHRIAYAYWLAGDKTTAEKYFDEQVSYCEEIIKMGRWYSREKWAYYDLACIYAFRRDKEKAIQLLQEVNTREFFPLWWVVYFKYDPLLDNLRSDGRFQKILREVEDKYTAKHEGVKKWLEGEHLL